MSEDISFHKLDLHRITTGSRNFDTLLGGGLPVASITDIYGAAGTGKTQFAFQNAVFTCDACRAKLAVVFVDCTGSFRPERIAEIAENRSIEPDSVLEKIVCISVRSVEEQKRASDRVLSDRLLSSCRLFIVDDVTVNFVSEYGREEDVASRQSAVALYARSLGKIANSKGVSVILTNSVRSRGDKGEGETTGEIFAEFSFCRMHFARKDRTRMATLVQPDLRSPRIRFDIEAGGIR